jgi:hypothetical protein
MYWDYLMTDEIYTFMSSKVKPLYASFMFLLSDYLRALPKRKRKYLTMHH